MDDLLQRIIEHGDYRFVEDGWNYFSLNNKEWMRCKDFADPTPTAELFDAHEAKEMFRGIIRDTVKSLRSIK